jgi:hypothetical protein
MKPDRPPMPKERPTITLGPLTATLDNDNARYSSGFVRMTFQDTTARLMEGGKEVGNVTGPIGGGVQVSINDRQWYYTARGDLARGRRGRRRVRQGERGAEETGAPAMMRDGRGYNVKSFAAIRASLLADWRLVEPWLSRRWKTTMHLAGKAGLSQTRAIRALSFAVEHGLIEVEYRPFRGGGSDIQRQPFYRAKGPALGCTENPLASEHGKTRVYPVKNRPARPTSE